MDRQIFRDVQVVHLVGRGPRIDPQVRQEQQCRREQYDAQRGPPRESTPPCGCGTLRSTPPGKHARHQKEYGRHAERQQLAEETAEAQFLETRSPQKLEQHKHRTACRGVDRTGKPRQEHQAQPCPRKRGRGAGGGARTWQRLVCVVACGRNGASIARAARVASTQSLARLRVCALW